MDLGDQLKPRGKLIGHCFRNVDSVWRWENYDWHENLSIGQFKSGELIRYHRPKNWMGAIEMTGFNPIGIENRVEIEIPIGTPSIIDALTATGLNFDGAVDVQLNYEGEFSKTKSSSEAFSHGLTESLEVSVKFTQGNDASFVKAEQEIKAGFEARQDWSRSSSDESQVRKLASLSPLCPKGYDIVFRLIRKSQKKKLKVTGFAKVDHGFQIGKHHSKEGFKGHRGKHRKLYSRWAKFDSFYEQFLPVIKREAPRDYPFASHFQKNPVPDWLIAKLEDSPKIPFEHTSQEFDGWTDLEQTQEVLRGPKAA